jgi:predicted transposase YdaD
VIYDIASKRLAEIAPVALLRLLLNAPLHPDTQLEDLPQEMPTLNRADRVWRVICPGEEPFLVLGEFQTHWDTEKKLDIMLYVLWLKKKYRLRVVPVVLLCLPNTSASDVYSDENCSFKFNLVRAYELDGAALLTSRELGLYPLLPLMRGGLALAESAGREIYESKLEPRVKADLLALLGVFLGLTDKEKAVTLIWQRTDFMNVLAESPIYQMIQEEGRRIGEEQGRRIGEEQGRKIGRAEGLVQAVKLGLELRFGSAALSLMNAAESCSDSAILTKALEAIRSGCALEEVQSIFNRAK